MSSTEPNLDSIRKLLLLKRYEQPPPGFFLRFPDSVLARLERGDLSESTSLWSWFLSRFDARPTLACAYATLLSSLLITGFWVSHGFHSDVTAQSLGETRVAWIPRAAPYLSEPFQSSPIAPTDLTFASGNAQTALRPQLAYGFFRSSPVRLRPATFSTFGY